MTPEERDIIGRFIARVGGAQQSSGFSGSVPATTTPLPPIDPEADRFIGEQFNAVPEARYRLTQMAFVQEAALSEAQNRIKRLEYELSQARQQAQAQPQQSKGLFGGLFGGGQSQPQQPYQQQQYAPPPQPVYAQGGYQPGMFQSGGSGFFGSALRTAAGVAGGVLAADAISSMFEPHNYGGFGGGGFGGGGFGGGGFGGGEVVNETVVNNYGPQDGGGDPWAGAGASAPPDPSFGNQGGDAWSGSGDASSGGDAWSGGGAADDSGGGWDSSGSDDSGSF
jgi:hypothetical protein